MVPAPRAAGGLFLQTCGTAEQWWIGTAEVKREAIYSFTAHNVHSDPSLKWHTGTVLMRRLLSVNHISQHRCVLHNSYDPDNGKLLRCNTNIIMATQTYIYDPNRFCGKNQTNSLPPVSPAVPFPVPRSISSYST